MKNNIRKILTVVIAVVCIFCVQISVSAIEIGDNLNWDSVLDLIGQLTAENPANTTTQEETTTSGEDLSSPVSSTGSGTHSTEAQTTTQQEYPTYNNNNYTNVNNNNGYTGNLYTTTEPSGDESTTLSFEASLSDIFEDDSAALIVQTPTETYTIGSLVVKNDTDADDEFTWQMGALIAAAVLFVVLLALIVALIIQNSKKKKKRRYHDSYPKSEGGSAPVPVEIMTPERIAELLGSSSGRNFSGGDVNMGSYETMSSDETAAAIRAAALMGQLSDSYSDPLLKKYYDEPVMISSLGSSISDVDSVSVADILKATDYIVNDIEASDGAGVPGVNINAPVVTASGVDRICPECGNDVPVDDVFCHNCGTYIG